MDTSERLAAYAAGELAPDEITAVEAALAGDPALRAQLTRIRRTDDLLAELPAVEPPTEFSDRLRATLVAELAQGAPVVDLAARRDRRVQRWLAPAAGVAAAGAAVFGLAQMTGFLGAADEAETAAMSPMADADTQSGMGDSAETSIVAGDEASAPGPVYAEGGSYDRDTLALLGANDQILAARDFAGSDPSAFQFAFLDRLSEASAASQRTGIAQTAPAAPGIAAEAEGAPADGQDSADASSDDGATSGGQMLVPVSPVTACIPVILDEGRVPLFADLGRFEGADALIVVLGAEAPDGSFSRLEFWVLAPDTCDVLHFAQR